MARWCEGREEKRFSYGKGLISYEGWGRLPDDGVTAGVRDCCLQRKAVGTNEPELWSTGDRARCLYGSGGITQASSFVGAWITGVGLRDLAGRCVERSRALRSTSKGAGSLLWASNVQGGVSSRLDRVGRDHSGNQIDRPGVADPQEATPDLSSTQQAEVGIPVEFRCTLDEARNHENRQRPPWPLSCDDPILLFPSRSFAPSRHRVYPLEDSSTHPERSPDRRC